VSAALDPAVERPGAPVAPTQLFPLTRHLSYRLTLWLVRTPITPNQITALSLAAGLAGSACFLSGEWAWSVAGAALLVVGYTLDNCDGEIARLKNLSSPWGAMFDDIVDWLVDGSFFAALGYGVSLQTGNPIWLWLGAAAAAGATLDYLIDIVLHERAKRDPGAKSREETASAPRQPQDALDWVIYVFHKLSRADFCIIVLLLALGDVAWILLPAGAIGAQVYWVTDLFERARGWHT
jgi:phosphatidylglycerophosphate synthase